MSLIIIMNPPARPATGLEKRGRRRRLAAQAQRCGDINAASRLGTMPLTPAEQSSGDARKREEGTGKNGVPLAAVRRGRKRKTIPRGGG